LLGVKLKPAARQHLHINALTRLNAQMGQQFFAQRHLTLAGDVERTEFFAALTSPLGSRKASLTLQV
jgi:hypothetical protein